MLRRTTYYNTSSKTPLENVFSKKFMAMSLLKNISRSVHNAPHSVDETRFLLSAQPLSGAGAERLWGYLNPPTPTSLLSNNIQRSNPSIGQRYNCNLEDAHLREPLDIIAVDRAVRNDLKKALRGRGGDNGGGDTLLSTHSIPASRKVLMGYNSRTEMMAQYLASHSQLRPPSSTKVGKNMFLSQKEGNSGVTGAFSQIITGGVSGADSSSISTESTPKAPMTEAELRVVNMAKLAAILAGSGAAISNSAFSQNEDTSTTPSSTTSPVAKRVWDEADRAAYKQMVAKYMWLYGRLRSNKPAAVGAKLNHQEAPRPVSPGQEGVHLKPVADRYEGPFPFAAEFLSASPNTYAFTSSVVDGVESDIAHSLLAPSSSLSQLAAGTMPLIKHTPSFVIEEKLPESVVAENEDVILVLTATKLEGAHEPLASSRRVDGVTRCPTRSPRYLVELRLVPQVPHSQTATVPIVVNTLFTMLDCGRRLLRKDMSEVFDDGSGGSQGRSPFEIERSASGEDEMNSRGKGDTEAVGESAVQSISVPTLVEYTGLMGASDTITIAQLFGPRQSPFSPQKPPTSFKEGDDDDGEEEEEDVVSVYVPLHKSMSISLATMDGPAALKGRIYYKMVESSTQPPSPSSAHGTETKVVALKSGTIHSLSRKEASSAPIRCIEFSPVALR